ncbi:DNA polymerase III, subunits gamma and tau (fragment) [Candidatus Desulfosporosinus infrequens]|uniref:DNA polymerase III, subunits gamma and tau n=1 Tax=Candidatus Desulfosporosinus infrequens TaxID=2043169 RepID=A0A2U3LKV8_9FIRM
MIPNDLTPSQKTPKAEPKRVDLGNTAPGAKPDLRIEGIQERWNDVLDQVKKRKKSTQAFLMEGKPVQLEENTLTLLFREGCSFHKDKVSQIENRQTIEEVLKQLFGISLTLQNFMENEFQTKQTPDNQELKSQEQALIDKAKEMFGADRVVVKEG